MRTKIQVQVLGVSTPKVQSEICILLLGECDGSRHVPVVIGNQEAYAIVSAMEVPAVKRTLVHDLFIKLTTHYHINLREVYIYRFQEDVFLAEVHFEHLEELFTSTVRVSDAIALALRGGCPIYTEESILTTDTTVTVKTSKPFHELTLPELQEMLQLSVSKEMYEQAALIRDEISRRQSAQTSNDSFIF
jgi:bifunctional DNase/RNase